MTEKKKSWGRPQLIVLGRGRPEESVLQACKHPNAGIVGPGDSETLKCQRTAGDVSGACKERGVT